MSSSAPPRTGSPPSTGNRVLITAVSILGGLALLVLSVFWFGRVSGEEFCPDTFERRHFSYFEIPVVHLQVWPISRADVSNKVESYLETEKLLPPPKKLSVKEWDLSHLMRGTTVVREGDALILCSYLDTFESDGGSRWQTWSEKNPKLAKVLWPLLAELARGNHYIFVPDVMELAKSASEPLAFQKALDELLVARFMEQADAQQQLGHHAFAAELYDAALRHAAPEHPDRARLDAAGKQSRDIASPPALPAEAPLAPHSPTPNGS